MTIPLSEQYGTQLDPADKAVIDYWLINPAESVHKAVVQGYPKTVDRGGPPKFRYIRSKLEVERYVSAKRREMEAKTSIKMAQTLIEIAAISHSNVYDYINISSDGKTMTAKPKAELSELQQRCVKELKIENTTVVLEDGNVERTSEIKLTLWDKQKAQNDLARLLGWNGKPKDDIPDRVKEIMEIGVLVLPAGLTPEEAIANYLPYEGQVIDSEK